MGLFDFLRAPAKPQDWPRDPDWWRELHEQGFRPPEDPRELPRRQESLPHGRRKLSPSTLPKAADVLNPGLYFDLVRLSGDIEEARASQEFKRELEASKKTGDPAVVPLFEIAPSGPDQADRIFRFFGLPLEEAKKDPALDPWKHFIDPFIEKLERRLNEILPDEYPGYIEFGTTEDGAFGLVYLEKEDRA
jgi:hypothetical protein